MIVLVEGFLRHAIHAAEIATIGDGDAQIMQWSRQGIGEPARGTFQTCRNGRGVAVEAMVDDGNDALVHNR
jgi:hypothetical protein